MRIITFYEKTIVEVEENERVESFFSAAQGQLRLPTPFAPPGHIRQGDPIPRLVDIDERRACDLVPEVHVVARGGLRRQTGLDVAQTLAVEIGRAHV